MIAYCRADGLLAQGWAEFESGMAGAKRAPDLAIVCAGHAVADAGRAAAQAGVRCGMTLRAARYHCPEGIIVPLEEAGAAAAADRFYRAAANHSPRVEPEGYDSVFLDLRGCDAAAEVAALRAAVVPALAFRLRCGLADTKLAAKIAAFRPGAVSAWADLPVRYLWTVPAGAREALEALGCRTAGAAAALSKSELIRRFGRRDGHLIWEACRGIDPRPVESRYPPQQITAAAAWEEGLHSQQAARAAAQALGQRLARALHAAGWLCGELQLRAAFLGLPLPHREATRFLAQPSADPQVLSGTLCLLLQRVGSRPAGSPGQPEFPGPLAELQARAARLVPQTAGQLDLWGQDHAVAGRLTLAALAAEQAVHTLSHQRSRPAVVLGKELRPSRYEQMLRLLEPWPDT